MIYNISERDISMEYNHILELIKTVSESNLTNFHYEEGNVKIHMSSGDIMMMEPGFGSCNNAAQSVRANAVEAEVGNSAVTKADNTAVGTDSENMKAQNGDKKSVFVNAQTINSPLVGTFYAAPAEDAQPFVKLGDRVKKGQIVGIVEAMKLMNEIEAECDGIVTEILVENATGVEYGEALFVVE